MTVVSAGRKVVDRVGLPVAPLVDDALALLEAEHGRSAQREIGASEVGECARKIRWTLEERPFTDEDPPGLMAAIGTATHAHLLPAIARVSGDPFAEVERKVEAVIGGMRIPGTLDLFAHRTVVDLKTRGTLDSVKRDGPKVVEIAQVAVYVEGLRQAGEQVRRAVLLYVGRAYGDVLEVEVTEQEIEDVLAVLEAFVAQALEDEAAPRVDVTGRDRRSTDAVCRFCRFRSACWGDPPRPAVLLDEGRVEVVEALEGLYEARRLKRTAEADAEWWASILEDTPAGDYPGWTLKRKRGSAPGMAVDAKAAQERLEAAGLEVPMKPTNGRRGSVEVLPN